MTVDTLICLTADRWCVLWDQTLGIADGDSTSGTCRTVSLEPPEDGTVSGSMTFTEIETLILPEDPVEFL